MDAKGILITVVVIVVLYLIIRALFFSNQLTGIEDAKKGEIELESARRTEKQRTRGI